MNFPNSAAPFSLLETILWEPQEGYFLLNYHLQRLQNSATYFHIPVDIKAAEQQLHSLVSGFFSNSYKIRLLIAQDGSITCESIPIDNLTVSHPDVRLGLSTISVDPSNPFLYHKTTNRQIYQLAHAGCTGCDDVLLYNHRGEITETCIGNCVVNIQGELLTPPVTSGLLPGTFRAFLLAQGQVKEKVLTINLLEECQQIYVINSVRKWRKAVLTRL